MSATLRINLLGPFSVARDAQTLPDTAWHSRHSRRLLMILLSARGAPVSNERLLEWLWPETPAEIAASNLRSTISSLRRLLDGSAARASGRYIQTRSGGYAWNLQSGAWIDSEEFLDLTSERSINAQTIAQYEQALSLYRGEYLAEEPDARWALELRQFFNERYFNTILVLCEYYQSQANYQKAIELASRGLARDPLREPLYRALMQAQALAGDTASALRSYEQYREVLDLELGAEPSPQTQALHRAILRGELQALPIVAPPQISPPSGKPQRSAHNKSPFVGRTAEFELLRQSIDELKQRHGSAIALVGEAGIGKTRLAQEARRYAEKQGASVVWLRCNVLDHDLPFAPLGEAMRPLIDNAPEILIRRIPPTDLAQIADLLPALRERVSNLPTLPDVPPAERRNRQLDGLVSVALAISRIQPFVICCDDAQWADEATLACLGRLANHIHRHALMIVIAYRAEEQVENPALHTLIRNLGRTMLLQPLLLQRFNDHEIAQFLQSLAPNASEQIAQLAPRLASSSNGNPFFLNVAVQSLLEAYNAQSLDQLLPKLPADAPLPNLANTQHIRDLILSRIEQLSPESRNLLDLLALLGRSASLDLIEACAGIEGLNSAQTLLERGFLIEQANERLQLAHDVLGAIVVDSLSSPRRRLLHRQLADALSAIAMQRSERAAEIAFHYAQSGHSADPSLLRYAIVAAEHARRAYAYQAAFSHYNTALGAAERLGAQANPEQVRQALTGRLHTCEALLDWNGILETNQRYEQWPQPLGSGPLVAPRRLVLLRALLGDLAGAAQLSAKYAQQPPESSIILQDMLERTAQILESIATPDFSDWQSAFEQTRGDFPSSPPPPQNVAQLEALLGAQDAAMALFQIGWAYLIQGHIAEAEPNLQRAYELGLQTSQAAVAVISALQIAHLYSLQAQSDQCKHWLQISLDLAKQAPEALWASIWPRLHQGFLYLLSNQTDDAYNRFQTMAHELRELPTLQSHRASVEVGLGLVAINQDDYQAAEQHLKQALASPQLLYGFVQIIAQHGLARIASSRGQTDLARRILGQTLYNSAKRDLLPEYIRTALEICKLERDYGNLQSCQTLLEHSYSLAQKAQLHALSQATNLWLKRLGNGKNH